MPFPFPLLKRFFKKNNKESEEDDNTMGQTYLGSSWREAQGSSQPSPATADRTPKIATAVTGSIRISRFSPRTKGQEAVDQFLRGEADASARLASERDRASRLVALAPQTNGRLETLEWAQTGSPEALCRILDAQERAKAQLSRSKYSLFPGSDRHRTASARPLANIPANEAALDSTYPAGLEEVSGDDENVKESRSALPGATASAISPLAPTTYVGLGVPRASGYFPTRVSENDREKLHSCVLVGVPISTEEVSHTEAQENGWASAQNASSAPMDTVSPLSDGNADGTEQVTTFQQQQQPVGADECDQGGHKLTEDETDAPIEGVKRNGLDSEYWQVGPLFSPVACQSKWSSSSSECSDDEADSESNDSTGLADTEDESSSMIDQFPVPPMGLGTPGCLHEDRDDAGIPVQQPTEPDIVPLWEILQDKRYSTTGDEEGEDSGNEDYDDEEAEPPILPLKRCSSRRDQVHASGELNFAEVLTSTVRPAMFPYDYSLGSYPWVAMPSFNIWPPLDSVGDTFESSLKAYLVNQGVSPSSRVTPRLPCLPIPRLNTRAPINNFRQPGFCRRNKFHLPQLIYPFHTSDGLARLDELKRVLGSDSATPPHALLLELLRAGKGWRSELAERFPCVTRRATQVDWYGVDLAFEDAEERKVYERWLMSRLTLFPCVFASPQDEKEQSLEEEPGSSSERAMESQSGHVVSEDEDGDEAGGTQKLRRVPGVNWWPRRSSLGFLTSCG